MKKKVVSMLCTIGMVLSVCSFASAAEADTTTTSGNEQIDNIIINAFEKPGYQISKEDEDFTEEFFAAMAENYGKKDLAAINEYLLEMELSVSSPGEFVEDPIQPRGVTKVGVFADEGLNYVKNLINPNIGSNQIYWSLTSQITYDTIDEKIVKVGYPKMYYSCINYGDVDPEFITDRDKTGYNLTDEYAEFWFAVDCNLFGTSNPDLSEGVPYPILYQYRTAGTAICRPRDIQF